MTSGGGLREKSLDDAQLARMLDDASIDQILALDTNLNVIDWNKACERISGISKQKAIGSQFTNLFPEASALPAIMEAIEMALKGFKSFVPWEKGSYGGGYFENHFVPLKEFGDDGPVIGVVNIIHDVAHRTKAERELQSLNRELMSKVKELRQKSDELANFNYIISHDLKEPLRKIYIFIEMAAIEDRERLSENARTNLQRAQSAVQRMEALTDDLITFSQVTASNERLQDINLRHSFVFAKHQLQSQIDASAAIVEADSLPTIRGYQDLLEHLWRQMLSNALKFQQEGNTPQVRVSYRRLAGDQTGNPDADPKAYYHCLSFTDNGIGMDTAFDDKIFGMFQRLHPQSAYKGSGMGLAICRKIVEAHEGFIKAESVAGQGSTFHCFLKDFGSANH